LPIQPWARRPSVTLDGELAVHAEQLLRELRQRRSAGRAPTPVWEQLARLEVGILVAGYVVLGLWLLVGGPPIEGRALQMVGERGPAATGLAAAMVTGLSLGAGLRGAPWVFSRADVHHVLLAPVERLDVFLSAAVRQLGRNCGAGATLGSVAGVLTASRLPGGLGAWVVSGALAGVLVGLLATAPALIISGRGTASRRVNLAWLAVVGMAVADLAAGTHVFPPSWIGLVALWPLAPSPLALAAFPLVAVVVAVGLGSAGGTPLELVDRRAGLVSELRFAAALRDVRGVTRTWRSLAQETPRSRPWLRFRPSLDARRAVWRRHWRSLDRWPGGRLVRVAALALGIAGALALAWLGASYFLVVAALLAYLVGLEVLEPWWESVERPDLTDSLPIGRAGLLFRHGLAALVAGLVAGLVALAAVAAMRPPPRLIAAAGVLLVCAALSTVCGAVVRSRGDVAWEELPQNDAFGSTGYLIVMHLVAAPSVVLAGLVPVLIVRDVARAGGDPLAAAAAAGPIAAGVAVLLLLLFRVLEFAFRVEQ
jgi:hypothetical protein